MDGKTEPSLLANVRARPEDDEARVVYADWLEAQARHSEAEFLRLQVALKKMGLGDEGFDKASARLNEIAPTLDQDWRLVVARAPIEKCEVRFDFTCPKTWDALEPPIEAIA